jgi:hypothetical protein
MIISATNLVPRIGFDGLCGGVVLIGLLIFLKVGSFVYFLHQEIHFGREYVHPSKAYLSSLVGCVRYSTLDWSPSSQ